MLRRHALIRRLPAVETLGSVSVICTDKTGTLTENRMTVCGLEVFEGPGKLDERLLLLAGVLCNDAQLRSENGETVVVGDPTEGALLMAAAEQGINREELERQFPRIAEIPFDSAIKRMITVHSLAPGPWALDPLPQSGKLLVAKGALDAVLELCSGAINDIGRQTLATLAERRSEQGERVLALAIRTVPPDADLSPDLLGNGFRCIGLAAIADPPRAEARAAVLRCLSAGIRPVMITGDHPLTARAIAREVGIPDESGALTGVELERMTQEQFDEATARVSIYARVTPEHKLKIVESLHKQGLVVSMTGDGVNDAPALKKADVGVAMGKAGTDVAREASDMVLLDDNFATIVAAVEEGRTIYDNIRKFVVFSVAGNTGKILAVLLLPFLGLPMPLTPLQLLWLNLLTDGLLGLGMGVERPEPDVMKRPPIVSGSQIFDASTIRYVLLTGSLIGASCMALTWMVWQAGGPWQTVLFVSLALAQVGQAMALRSFTSSFASMGLFTNPLLLAMVMAVVLLQAGTVYLPVVQGFFRTAALDGMLLLLTVVPALAVFVLLELEKWVARLRRGQ
jgi:Ca2+-transporting ATPase